MPTTVTIHPLSHSVARNIGPSLLREKSFAHQPSGVLSYLRIIHTNL
jgi:hypothetical protein